MFDFYWTKRLSMNRHFWKVYMKYLERVINLGGGCSVVLWHKNFPLFCIDTAIKNQYKWFEHLVQWLWCCVGYLRPIPECLIWFKSWLLYLAQLPSNTNTGRQQMMAENLSPCHPYGIPRMYSQLLDTTSPVPTVGHIWEWIIWWSISLSACLCLSAVQIWKSKNLHPVTMTDFNLKIKID